MASKMWIGGDTTDPNKWSVAVNWEPSGIPANSDVVTIPAGSPAILDGLDQSGVQLDGFIVEEGFTSAIGTEITQLKIKLKVDDFLFAGTGTSTIEVSVAVISDVSPRVTQCGLGSVGVPGLELSGNAFDAIAFAGSGSLGVGTRPGDNVTRVEDISVSGNGSVVVGPGVEAAAGDPNITVSGAGATVTVDCDVNDVHALRGTYRQRDGKWLTAYIHEATAFSPGDGIYGTTEVDTNGKLYNNENNNVRTFTTVTITDGGTWMDPAGTGGYSNPVQFPTGMGRCTIDFGRKKKLTVANI